MTLGELFETLGQGLTEKVAEPNHETERLHGMVIYGKDISIHTQGCFYLRLLPRTRFFSLCGYIK